MAAALEAIPDSRRERASQELAALVERLLEAPEPPSRSQLETVSLHEA
jgi:hypothetical protein